jgi:predicted carbohydrate-binding protein with CBM5 and CBM33 domain
MTGVKIMHTAWQLQDAKNNFSRLIKLATEGEAQVVTVPRGNMKNLPVRLSANCQNCCFALILRVTIWSFPASVIRAEKLRYELAVGYLCSF